MTIDFELIYKTLSAEALANQKKLDINAAIGVFYGISPEGYFRLAFMSSVLAPKLESTRLLRVTQGKEKEGVYWTCFDLLNMDAKKVFYTFCNNLIEAIDSEIKRLETIKTKYQEIDKETPDGDSPLTPAQLVNKIRKNVKNYQNGDKLWR